MSKDYFDIYNLVTQSQGKNELDFTEYNLFALEKWQLKYILSFVPSSITKILINNIDSEINDSELFREHEDIGYFFYQNLKNKSTIIDNINNEYQDNSGFISDFEEAKISQEQRVAQKACEYARGFILKGTTQLETNDYNQNEKESLSKALGELRREAHNLDRLYIKTNRSILKFYKSVELCKKYSIGNCHELALLALDYAISNSEANAEVYYIKGGDHVFLVVGRDKNSDPNNPNTWGDNSFICDPWSDKVYPASKYQTELKNYYYNRFDDKNCIEEFNPWFHQLAPIQNQNSKNMNKADIHVLYEKYKAKKEMLDAAYQQLVVDFEHIVLKVKTKYGEDDSKAVAMQEHLNSLKDAVGSLSDIEAINEDMNYYDLSKVLSQKFVSAAKNISDASKISDERFNIISEHRAPDSFKTKFLKFFKVPTETKKDADKVVQNLNKSLGKIIRP